MGGNGWVHVRVNKWVSGWVHEEGREKARRNGGRKEKREKEWKSDKLLTFSVNLGSSAHPSQYSLHESAIFPPSVSTIMSTLNSVLRVAIFRTH